MQCTGFSDKLCMQTLCAKAIISSYPDKGWKLSTVKKVCSRVDCTASAIVRKPGSGDLLQRQHAQFVT